MVSSIFSHFPLEKLQHLHTFVKEIPLKLKSHTDLQTLKMRDFNTTLSLMDRSSNQNVNREILQLIDLINQMELIDIYRAYHTNTK